MEETVENKVANRIANDLTNDLTKNMDALSSLPTGWQKWVQENLQLNVPVEKIASKLCERHFYPAAFALLAHHQKTFPIPYIDTSGNKVDVGDRQVAILFCSYHPHVVVIDDFLSEEECEALITDASAALHESRIINPIDGTLMVRAARSSTSMHFYRGENELVSRIEARISHLLHWPVEHGEGIQVLRYADGGEYRPHYDFFDPAEAGYRAIMGKGGQRVGTLLMYLSDVEAGGATSFPKLNFEIRPKRGMALYFANVTMDMELEANSLHAGNPVTRGVKFLATKWLRQYSLVQ